MLPYCHHAVNLYPWKIDHNNKLCTFYADLSPQRISGPYNGITEHKQLLTIKVE